MFLARWRTFSRVRLGDGSPTIEVVSETSRPGRPWPNEAPWKPSAYVGILPVRRSEEGFFDCASRPEIEKARFSGKKRPPGRSAQNDEPTNRKPRWRCSPSQNGDLKRARPSRKWFVSGHGFSRAVKGRAQRLPLAGLFVLRRLSRRPATPRSGCAILDYTCIARKDSDASHSASAVH